MSGVYSEIRDLLPTEGAQFQKWIEAAIPRLGIVHRDEYLETFGWRLIGNTLTRHMIPAPMIYGPLPLDALGLLDGCIEGGLEDGGSARRTRTSEQEE